jgi:hypothetical protein
MLLLLIYADEAGEMCHWFFLFLASKRYRHLERARAAIGLQKCRRKIRAVRMDETRKE